MWQKEIKFADGIIRDYLGGPSPKNRRGGTKREVKLIQCKKDSPISVNLEDGRRGHKPRLQAASDVCSQKVWSSLLLQQ